MTLKKPALALPDISDGPFKVTRKREEYNPADHCACGYSLASNQHTPGCAKRTKPWTPPPGRRFRGIRSSPRCSSPGCG